MEKGIDISQIKKDTSPEGLFAVSGMGGVRSYVKGFSFTLELADRSGRMQVKFWGGANEAAVRSLYSSFSKGDIVQVKASASEYKGQCQLSVNEPTGFIRKCTDGVDLSLFLPSTEKDIPRLESELKAISSSIESPYLKPLISSFLDDPEFYHAFINSTGAKKRHHAYIGGLLEHTVGVMRLCRNLCEFYPDLDRDLLLAGAVLHDIGKIREYTASSVFDLSSEGRFVGHMVIGVDMLNERIARMPDFPDDLKMKLSHMLLSHHGKKEWGSPVEPVFAEAEALHYADNMDSSINTFLRESRNAEAQWEYARDLQRSIYTHRFGDGRHS